MVLCARVEMVRRTILHNSRGVTALTKFKHHVVQSSKVSRGLPNSDFHVELTSFLNTASKTKQK